MTTYFAVQYGGYTYQGGSAVASLEESLTYRARTSAAAGTGGRYTAGPRMDALMLTLQGTLYDQANTDPASVRAAWDAFKAAHAPGIPRQLMLDSDRYLMAEVASEVKASAWKGLPARDFAVTLASYDDPPWWEAAVNTQALSAGANTLTAGGTGSAAPIITLVVASAPPGGTVAITDSAGNACVLTPSAGTYLIDSTQEQVTLAGADSTGIFSGDFLSLSPGANTWTLAAAGGLILTSASVSWQNRCY